jgi:small subunit ribosomal protein S1
MELNYDFNEIQVGQKVVGTVVYVDNNQLVLDFGAHLEGTIYANQFTQEDISDLSAVVSVGDEIEAYIKKFDDNHGTVLLSRLQIEKEEKMEVIKELQRSKEKFEVTIARKVNKGFIAKHLGFEIFIPDSQVGLDIVFNEQDKIDIVITEYDFRKNRIIGSRRFWLTKEIAHARAEELAALSVGQVLEGKITRIERYGAFVTFNHVTALVMIKELSHYFINNISDEFNIGDTVEVKITKIDGNKVNASRKVLLKTPFETFVDTVDKTKTIEGKVVKHIPNGMLVEVAPRVVGLLRYRDYSWDLDDKSYETLKPGAKVDVLAKEINSTKREILLSRKDLEENPWLDIKIRPREEIDVEISEIVSGSHAVFTFEGIEGQIPMQEIALDKRNINIDDFLKVGQKVTVRVKDFHRFYRKFVASIKDIEYDARKEEVNQYMSSNTSAPVTLGEELGIDLEELYKKLED